MHLVCTFHFNLCGNGKQAMSEDQPQACCLAAGPLGLPNKQREGYALVTVKTGQVLKGSLLFA